ncbi:MULTISPECIES: hypothetical protein [unclassified Amycolatopsis]|uniref:hypothetical protein n=1 Tax=unclassified Amycolatopsis TaxID=2618356 RepID=UPI002714AE6D|nr:hypothetical protein [Amycolatopsis sp. DSM 110486]
MKEAAFGAETLLAEDDDGSYVERYLLRVDRCLFFARVRVFGEVLGLLVARDAWYASTTGRAIRPCVATA